MEQKKYIHAKGFEKGVVFFPSPDHRLEADSGKTLGDGRVWALSLHRNQGSSQSGTTMLHCHVPQR